MSKYGLTCYTKYIHDFFPCTKNTEFIVNATGSPVELMMPDRLTIAVTIHESSEYEKLRSFFFFIKAS